MAKSYTVSEKDGVKTIDINFSIIKHSLESKLRKEDLEKGSEIVLSALKKAEFTRNIQTGCIGMNCKNAGNGFRSVPAGPSNADYMFVDFNPSKIEAITGTVMTGRTGITLSMLFDKIGVDRNDIYFTNLCKCTSKECVDDCIKNHFLHELDMVKPKVLVCNGIETLRKCFTSEAISLPTFMNIDAGPYLPEPMECGMLYRVETQKDEDLYAIGITNINSILNMDGQDYHNGKNILWEQLKLAFRDYKRRNE